MKLPGRISIPKPLRLALSWGAALLVIYLIFRQIDPQATWQAIRSVSPGLLLLALALLLAGLLLRCAKWLIALRGEYGAAEIVSIFFVTQLAGGVLPARLGDAAPLVRERYRTKRMTAFLIVNRLLETYATLLLGALGFVMIGFADTRVTLTWLAVLLGMSIVLFVLLQRALWARLQERFTSWPLVPRLAALLERLSVGLRALGALSGSLLVLTFLATGLDFVFVKFLYASFGEPIDLGLVAAGWCVIGLASVIAFTPGGLGLADAPGMVLYRRYGVSEAAIGAGFVLGRAVTTTLPWLAFLVFLVCERLWKKQTAPITPR